MTDSSIAAFLAMEGNDVQYEVEPFLLRSRLVTVAPGGRRIEQRGVDYLVATRRQMESL